MSDGEGRISVGYDNVVWDWNGTLLNDLDVGVNVLNAMLGRRGIPAVPKERYRQIFRFPVIDFYREVGFDLEREDFHALSVEFVNTYARFEAQGMSLNEGAVETLKELKRRGVRSYILTALKDEFLREALEEFEIADLFTAVYGAKDIYAAGKVGTGRALVSECSIYPPRTIMVGDTVHDAEVSRELGFHPVLFTGGHNDVKYLEREGDVINALSEVLNYF